VNVDSRHIVAQYNRPVSHWQRQGNIPTVAATL